MTGMTVNGCKWLKMDGWLFMAGNDWNGKIWLGMSGHGCKFH